MHLLSLHRIVKQAIRAGGSTLNQKHVEDISLSGLFLMKVTKRIECEFGVHHSTSHTTSDCLNEINKIVDHLTKATENSPLFTDPTVTGLQKIFNTAWIKNTLNRSELFEEPTEDTDSAHQHQIADIMYELTDTL